MAKSSTATSQDVQQPRKSAAKRLTSYLTAGPLALTMGGAGLAPAHAYSPEDPSQPGLNSSTSMPLAWMFLTPEAQRLAGPLIQVTEMAQVTVPVAAPAQVRQAAVGLGPVQAPAAVPGVAILLLILGGVILTTMRRRAAQNAEKSAQKN